MARHANIYDICDEVVRKGSPAGYPGENLQKFYAKLAHNIFFKAFVLKGCRHPGIGRDPESLAPLRGMLASAMDASLDDWDDEAWIRETFAPLARLLDAAPKGEWRVRAPYSRAARRVDRRETDSIFARTLDHALKVFRKNPADPHFPLAAQVVLPGDECMSGENLLEILTGLGSVEYRNATVVFALVRALLLSCPRKLAMVRKPWKGIAEPLNLPISWIMHRTAFYDVIFFEQLLGAARREEVAPDKRREIEKVLESLIHYIVVVSREWLTSPSGKHRYPALTCLPMDEAGLPLCSMKASDWKKKQDLGFDDYVPDVDTTFLGLAMARKWLDYVDEQKIEADGELLGECRAFLDHPWVEIVAEYQMGGGRPDNPATILLTGPLDCRGAVPLWLHKPFDKPGGRVVMEILGNEICAGHNMDILDTILVNRDLWGALAGENLETARRFLDFHHRAFLQGTFADERSVRFYLPEMYLYYAARLYQTALGLTEDERKAFDPDDKLGDIRRIALDHIATEMAARTMNPFDASLAAAALGLFRAGADDPGCAEALERSLAVMADALGEGKRGRPYKAYEWTLVRYPTRIIVGSPVATSLFVMSGLAEARKSKLSP